MGDTADRNLALLLTPPGTAAIAGIRLSGNRVADFLRTHFARPAQEGKPVHGTLTDGDRVIDDPVVVLSPGGTVADLNVHGGAWVVRSVLDLARRAGFEVVHSPVPPVPEPAVDGETVLEREALAYLPLARTELAARALLAQPVAWGERTADIDPAQTLADRALHHLLHPPRVAVVGVPNVGKSTLANQLYAQERSITADLPGTTRDWVGEITNIDGLAVMLVDTPGLRETADVIEREAIGRGREQIAAAGLVVIVMDPTQALGPQRELLEAYLGAIRVVNEYDRPGLWDPSAAPGAIRTVATTGQGVDELRTTIRRHFLGELFDPLRPRWWTPRQREILAEAVNDPLALGRLWG